jgi:hypothetical protein
MDPRGTNNHKRPEFERLSNTLDLHLSPMKKAESLLT